ncbi:serine/threonine protein kinase [Pleurocapsales cyanobacterium LEGE 06147]|nr:serine/threonine protein kinase [Pleurocapsales cyanobacterium LEGE 06147]
MYSKYRILRLIGQGQFGRVFCAAHCETGELVALKELDRQQFPTKLFLRELHFLVTLQHPNIVSCRGLEYDRTGRYLVMDYCPGGTLRDLMESQERLDLSQILKLITDVLLGLEYAHSHRVVHCDLKPENILLESQDEGWLARISDFGIARFVEEVGRTITNQGNTGSPAYMSPERFYGCHSYVSDIYSVGVILFELLVGQRPFSGVPGELMSAHLNQVVIIPDTVPLVLRSTISTALQKLPQRRFASAREMLKSIQIATKSLSEKLPSLFQLSDRYPHPYHGLTSKSYK